MIFVTVGTHEQQFDRLIRFVDEMKLPDVFMQIGYSDYLPENCRYERMIGFEDMNKYTREADIVITQGGPGSIMLPLQMGKVPVVVPRQYKFGEHINDHQVHFTRHLQKDNKILAVYDIDDLRDMIENYQDKIKTIDAGIKSNNRVFNERFSKVVEELFEKKGKRKEIRDEEDISELLTCDILGVPVSVVNMEQTKEFLTQQLKELRGKYVCVSNVHTTVMAYESSDYGNVQRQAALVLPDGKPLSIVCRWRGYKQACRVAGPDLMPQIFELSQDKGYRHYFYGSKEETLQLFMERLKREYPRLSVAGYYAPPFRELTGKEDQEIVRMINETRPDFVWVGLGAPKQENWMYQHKDRIDGVMLGVGAAFDFYAGTVKRAPKWIQELCLEWLYRLIQDPRRLFKRYLKSNFKFLWLVLRGK